MFGIRKMWAGARVRRNCGCESESSDVHVIESFIFALHSLSSRRTAEHARRFDCPGIDCFEVQLTLLFCCDRIEEYAQAYALPSQARHTHNEVRLVQ